MIPCSICVLEGNFSGCKESSCANHDNWIVREYRIRLKSMTDLANSLDSQLKYHKKFLTIPIQVEDNEHERKYTIDEANGKPDRKL